MNEYPDAVPVLRVTVAVPGLRDLYLASASPPEVVAVPSGALPHPSLLPPPAPTELERQALAWDAALSAVTDPSGRAVRGVHQSAI